MAFPAEPSLLWRDISVVGTPRWDEVDDVASEWLGRPCVALPSVRVGLCWALEFAGLRRHRSHVLVPRYVGRCILNSLGRVAMPVETPTAETQAAIVVDQYGLRQNREILAAEFERRGWVYVEDSPYGIAMDESPDPASLGRFIGLGKLLPVPQGALLVSADAALMTEVRRRRQEYSAWSWPVWFLMAALRSRREATTHSEVADAAYEMYLAARGGHRWLRGNVRRVLLNAATLEAESRDRFNTVCSQLHGRILVPDLNRFGYVVPFPTEGDETRVMNHFGAHGFDGGLYHVDTARNMLAPTMIRCALIPVNPRIPRPHFDRLIGALSQ